MDVTGALREDVIGRESELAAVHEFLASGPLPRALVVTGEPGIGKTTLWEASIDAAVERRMRVLTTRPRTIRGYRATPGWDPVTGWGSPNARVLIPLLSRFDRPG